MIKKFMSYYKPHLRLFMIDLFCACVVAICNIFYPRIVQLIIGTYAPKKEWQPILILCGVLLGIYTKSFLKLCYPVLGPHCRS